MRQNIKFLILFFTLVVSTAIMPKQVKAQQFGISFQTFYDELSSYGEWVDYPRYGYVWIPYAGPDFMPYSTQGQWIYTDYGWTWVSYYEWGWAPFHYGRWDYDNYYGWLWVPGNEWGPSWVTWVRSDGYYGWQPMQPGISISLSFGRDYRTNYDHWTFVRDRDFERSDIQRYYVDRSDHERIMKNINVINTTYNDRRRGTTYVSGPKRADVQKNTGHRVRSVSIRESQKPGQELKSGRLNIYRPEIRRTDNIGEKPAPSRISDIKEVKRPSERNSRPERQPNNVIQQNNDTKSVQPKQERSVRPTENKKQNQRQKTVVPKNNESNVPPARQRNASPATNSTQEPQQNKVAPQNENRQVKQSRQRKATPTNDNMQVQPEEKQPVVPENTGSAKKSKSNTPGKNRRR